MSADLDRLDGDAVRSLLEPDSFVRRVQVREEVSSTQDLLIDGGRTGDFAEGDVLAAERQRAGRGRHGRKWISEPGSSLTFSFLCRDFFPGRAGWITVGCALAVAEALDRAAGIDCRIKWPNDVFAREGKLAGILAQAFQGAFGPLIAVGIGLNVNGVPARIPKEPREEAPEYPAVCLKDLAGRAFERGPVLAAALNRISGLFRDFAAGRTLPVVEGLRMRSLLLGRRAAFAWKKERIEGRVLDHTEDLGLRIETPAGVVELPGEQARLIRILGGN